ncbi:MAG: cation transporter [Gammaproteobacteria bacterium]|jgi:cobalt-zinc-cadmium efflux system protein|nr:cation transporter [Gammaproteobacteria bacterium]MBP6050359.1 cation transporter [Pseudomonadales bacterium]MBK6583722.1 cation transporter [Gammaproteobacteria bacterium]MBK7170261.1 cation transporter [Gammaproteobacteria bacterium]MBK7727466.1 cation transporter [Gammaproteobacteria bacterium]
MSEHHHHHETPRNFGRAFALGITLNLGFVLVEAFYGWRAGSLALLADAGHNLSDVVGLILAWAGIAAARLPADDRHTYGWRRASIMAGFANAVLLLLAMGSLAWEALQRLQQPAPLAGFTVMAVAGIGVVINTLTALMLMSGSRRDLNIRGAFLHMAADALVSVGVVLAGALYLWRGWAWIDPVMALAIAVVIVVGTWSLLRQTLHLLFDGVPAHIPLGAVRECLVQLPGVEAVHDLHVWAMASSETALTAHLVVGDGAGDSDALLQFAMARLHGEFAINHVTLQIESPRFSAACTSVPGGCAA